MTYDVRRYTKFMASSDIGLRERGKRRRTDRILDAARQLLHEQPEQPITVERIAARAEVAPATVFNLVGNREQIWAALANRAFEELDAVTATAEDEPQDRARAIVDAVLAAITADAPVFRALLAGWSQSGRVLSRDPAGDFAGCLRDGVRSGVVADGLNLRGLGELLAAGLNGSVHQWAAGLISDEALRRRGRDLVDLVFAAARPATLPPRWELQED